MDEHDPDGIALLIVLRGSEAIPETRQSQTTGHDPQ